jgi:hypothetical protein
MTTYKINFKYKILLNDHYVKTNHGFPSGVYRATLRGRAKGTFAPNVSFEGAVNF